MAEKIEQDMQARVAALVAKVGGPSRAAEISGVSRNAIHKWRTGEARLPLVEMYALARDAGVTLEWLASGDDVIGSDAFALLKRRDVNSAGAVVDLPDVDWVQMPFRRDYLEHYGVTIEHAFVMVVSGDETLPTIHPTDVVVIDASKRDLSVAGLFAFVRFKRLMLLRAKMRLDGGVILIADNDSYGKDELSAEAASKLDIVGRVMANLSAQTTPRK